MKNYKQQLNQLNSSNSIDTFINSLDFSKLNISDIDYILDKLYYHIDDISDKSLIILIEKLSSVFDNIDNYISLYNNSFFDYMRNFLYGETYIRLLNHFIENNIYNPIIMEIYMTNSEAKEFITISDYYIDRFLNNLKSDKYFELLDPTLNFYFQEILDYIEQFSDKLIKNIDSDLKKKLNKSSEYFNLIMTYHEISDLINNNKVEEIFSDKFIEKLNRYNITIDNFIYNYLESINFVINNDQNFILPSNFQHFIDEIKQHISTNNEYVKDINVIIAKLGFKLNIEFENIIKQLPELDKQPDSILELFKNVLNNSKLDNKTKLDTLSLITLAMAKNYKSNKSLIEHFIFYTTYSTTIYTALINSVKIINNIDKLDINDKEQYELLKYIKSIDNKIYKQLLNKAKEELENIKPFIEMVDKDI